MPDQPKPTQSLASDILGSSEAFERHYPSVEELALLTDDERDIFVAISDKMSRRERIAFAWIYLLAGEAQRVFACPGRPNLLDPDAPPTSACIVARDATSAAVVLRLGALLRAPTNLEPDEYRELTDGLIAALQRDRAAAYDAPAPGSAATTHQDTQTEAGANGSRLLGGIEPATPKPPRNPRKARKRRKN